MSVPHLIMPCGQPRRRQLDIGTPQAVTIYCRTAGLAVCATMRHRHGFTNVQCRMVEPARNVHGVTRPEGTLPHVLAIDRPSIGAASWRRPGVLRPEPRKRRHEGVHTFGSQQSQRDTSGETLRAREPMPVFKPGRRLGWGSGRGPSRNRQVLIIINCASSTRERVPRVPLVQRCFFPSISGLRAVTQG